jgi:acrylyl-CoA reductase (NADPH)
VAISPSRFSDAAAPGEAAGTAAPTIMLPDKFHCYLVSQDAGGHVSAEITERPLDELPDGEAVRGHPGVNKVFPHVPGVDLAGVVAQSGVYEFVRGDPVLATGFDLGANRWGGYAEYARVPDDWIVPLPSGLSLRESMILGTAGFTAGLCVDVLQKHQVGPDRGEIAVTGASGGVGSVGRQEADDRSGRAMLHGRWVGAVDTVGGNMLTTILRATRHGGCVAACGLTAGDELRMTVYPFILRGITLAGIDAAWGPIPLRHEIWQRLAGPWKPDNLEAMAQFVDLGGLPPRVDDILAGRITGRVVLTIGGEEAGAGRNHEG